MNNFVLIFDGDCLFCNWIAYYLAKADTDDKFKFVSSTSEIGKQIITENKLQDVVNKTVIVKVGDVFFTKSKAVKKFLTKSRTYPVLRFLMGLLPTPIADFFYDLIAKNRKKIIRKECPILEPAIRKKFL